MHGSTSRSLDQQVIPRGQTRGRSAKGRQTRALFLGCLVLIGTGVHLCAAKAGADEYRPHCGLTPEQTRYLMLAAYFERPVYPDELGAYDLDGDGKIDLSLDVPLAEAAWAKPCARVFVGFRTISPDQLVQRGGRNPDEIRIEVWHSHGWHWTPPIAGIETIDPALLPPTDPPTYRVLASESWRVFWGPLHEMLRIRWRPCWVTDGAWDCDPWTEQMLPPFEFLPSPIRSGEPTP